MQNTMAYKTAVYLCKRISCSCQIYTFWNIWAERYRDSAAAAATVGGLKFSGKVKAIRFFWIYGMVPISKNQKFIFFLSNFFSQKMISQEKNYQSINHKTECGKVGNFPVWNDNFRKRSFFSGTVNTTLNPMLQPNCEEWQQDVLCLIFSSVSLRSASGMSRWPGGISGSATLALRFLSSSIHCSFLSTRLQHTTISTTAFYPLDYNIQQHTLQLSIHQTTTYNNIHCSCLSTRLQHTTTSTFYPLGYNTQQHPLSIH